MAPNNHISIDFISDKPNLIVLISRAAFIHLSNTSFVSGLGGENLKVNSLFPQEAHSLVLDPDVYIVSVQLTDVCSAGLLYTLMREP